MDVERNRVQNFGPMGWEKCVRFLLSETAFHSFHTFTGSRTLALAGEPQTTRLQTTGLLATEAE